MTAPDVAPYLSDFYVELSNLTDVASGAFVNDATVTVNLWTKSFAAIANAQNLSAAYVASSNGKYRATVPKTAGVAPNTTYKCEAKAVKGALEMHFWEDVIVQRLPA